MNTVPRIASESIPSDLPAGMKVLTLDSIRCVLFPESFLIDNYFDAEHTELNKKEFRFTPTTELIRDVDKKIVGQLFRAESIFIEQRLDDSTTGELLKGSKRLEKLKYNLKMVYQDIQILLQWDRQYVGYFNRKGDEMLIVNFVDLSSYANRKYYYRTFLISCCDGLEKLVRKYNYNIKKDSLSAY